MTEPHIHMSDARLWLESMHPILQWKVTFPQAENPFGKPMPTEQLKELAESKTSLLKRIGMRCLLDGEEIVTIKSLSRLTVQADHPKLRGLKRVDCEEYFRTRGIVEFIEAEMERIQQAYREVIEQREKERRRKLT